MEFSAQQLANYLKGRIVGDPTVTVSNFSKIEEGQPGTLTFLANPKYTGYIYTTKASIVLVNDNFVPEKEIQATLIHVPDSYAALASLLNMVESAKPKKNGIHPTAIIETDAIIGDNPYIGAGTVIESGAKIGNNVQIYPQVYIGDNAVIGDNTVIFPGVKIYNECLIGNNCIIHGGVVIGADGFGFAPTGSDYLKIPQIGNVVIEDNVEIGANTCIDRATMGSTIVRSGVKLDNLVQIAHNVEIGKNSVLAAQNGIAGSVKIGENCMFGGQAGAVGHIQVADGTKLGGQTGLLSSVKKPNQVMVGHPAIPYMKFMKSSIIFSRLPELEKAIYDIQKTLKNE